MAFLAINSLLFAVILATWLMGEDVMGWFWYWRYFVVGEARSGLEVTQPLGIGSQSRVEQWELMRWARGETSRGAVDRPGLASD